MFCPVPGIKVSAWIRSILVHLSASQQQQALTEHESLVPLATAGELRLGLESDHQSEKRYKNEKDAVAMILVIKLIFLKRSTDS
ncbi:hypothetical protein FRC00_008735, partial [Tulasnella sp. 408]